MPLLSDSVNRGYKLDDYKENPSMPQYIPEEDITETLPDGRVALVARKGVPVSHGDALRLGLVKPKQDVTPTETKADAGEVDATDAARELADAEGLDLTSVKGTGADGRITKGDVESALKS